MKRVFLKFIIILFISLIVFNTNLISQEDTTSIKTYGLVGVFFLDPYGQINKTAENYSKRNLQDALFINRVRSYYLGKLSHQAAIDSAVKNGCNSLLEVKSSIQAKTKRSNGFGTIYLVILNFYDLENPYEPLYTVETTYESKQALSAELADANALSGAIQIALKKISDDIYNFEVELDNK